MQPQNRLGHRLTEFNYVTVRIIDAEATLTPRMLLYMVNDFSLLFYLLKKGVDSAAFKVYLGIVGSDLDLFGFIFEDYV